MTHRPDTIPSGRDLAPATLTALHSAAARAQRDWRAVGLSAVVVRRGVPVWGTHLGSARLDPDRAPHDHTRYLVGSITKTFTACLVLTLRDAGALTLDDPLEAHLPGTGHGQARIRELLSHSSGLQREPVGRIWQSLRFPTGPDLLAGAPRASRVLPPSSLFHYSNLAYGLLGQLVERIEGRPWEAVLRHRLLDPLGMVETGVDPSGSPRARGYYVHPYAGTARPEPVLSPAATAPVGGLWSTTSDLARYAAFIAAPPSDVLGASTLEEMTRPVVMADLDSWTRGFGLGWELTRVGERVFVGHGGAMPGFLTALRVSRPDQVGAVVLTNVGSRALPGDLAERLVTLVLDHEPRRCEPWRPERAVPAYDELLGPWWSEGTEFRLGVEGGALVLRPVGGPAGVWTRFAPQGDDVFVAAQGRERGELLEVHRDGTGRVARLYFASYPMTRGPESFADLREVRGAPGVGEGGVSRPGRPG